MRKKSQNKLRKMTKSLRHPRPKSLKSQRTRNLKKRLLLMAMMKMNRNQKPLMPLPMSKNLKKTTKMVTTKS